MTKKKITSILLLFWIIATLFAQDNPVKSIINKKYGPATNLVVWSDEFNPTKLQKTI